MQEVDTFYIRVNITYSYKRCRFTMDAIQNSLFLTQNQVCYVHIYIYTPTPTFGEKISQIISMFLRFLSLYRFVTPDKFR